MIARIRGEIIERRDAAVVVDVAGVGYLVLVPSSADLPGRGRPVELHTSLQVREDSMTLYGFTSAHESRVFELLLGSSGVGPKLALAAVSTLRPAALEAAIAEGDVALLTTVPGIGRKVAERLVLELRERVTAAPPTAPAGTAGAEVGDDVLSEVRQALAGFGFGPGEVRDALAGLDAVAGETSGALLRRALQRLGRSAEVPR